MAEANDYAIPNLDPEDQVLTHLLSELDRLKGEIEDREIDAKKIKERLRDALGANGVSEFETATHKMQMTYPADRTTINREKLLLSGVPIDSIVAATDTTPVAPYINVRRKKGA